MDETDSIDIKIAGVHRALPLCRVAPGIRIAVLNILGDTELTEAAAGVLAERLAGYEYDALVTAEAKSIPLAHALSRVTGKPYVVLRKNYKSYMGEAIAAETRSITTGDVQRLYLDAKDRPLTSGARCILVDDVISSGSTCAAMAEILAQVGASVVGRAAIMTEGETSADDAVALAHVPVFIDAKPACRSNG